MRNLISDIDGITVGNVEDAIIKTGVTAILCDRPTTAACHVMGAAPGTRETDLLAPENTVNQIDAIALSGGSAFGLDAASGMQAFLKEQGRGFAVGEIRIPIVSGAILFDMINGGDKDWGRYPPYRELGYQAAKNAGSTFEIGSTGAGYGALVAGLKGGLGSASQKLPDGTSIAALIAVNAIGSPIIGQTGHFWAAPFEIGDEFGGLGLPGALPDGATDIDNMKIKFRDQNEQKTEPGMATTIGVIATDATLSKAEAKRLAICAHDGFARGLWPVHTPLDGDMMFALATGKQKPPATLDRWVDLCAAASAVTARAIARAVYEARPAKGDLFPTWREVYQKP